MFLPGIDTEQWELVTWSHQVSRDLGNVAQTAASQEQVYSMQEDHRWSGFSYLLLPQIRLFRCLNRIWKLSYLHPRIKSNDLFKLCKRTHICIDDKFPWILPCKVVLLKACVGRRMLEFEGFQHKHGNRYR